MTLFVTDCIVCGRAGSQPRADKLWPTLQSNSTVRVAILDTGLDYDHRELRFLVDLAASRSFVPDDPVPPTFHPVLDMHFHGTHVASTVATNLVSIASVAPHTTLIGVKVLGFDGSGTFEGITAGIMYAADVKAHVINMSLGGTIRPEEVNLPEVQALVETLSRAVRYAEKKGTIVVSAAGNGWDHDNDGDVLTGPVPANLDDPSGPVVVPCEVSTLCVSATGPSDRLASYSNFGITAIDIAAPGGDEDPNNPEETEETRDTQEDLILGACSRHNTQPGLAPCRLNSEPGVYFYAIAAGTSMATPHVSGAAAMLRARFPKLSVNGIRDKLLGHADDIGAAGRDALFGWGRLNVYRAVTGK